MIRLFIVVIFYFIVIANAFSQKGKCELSFFYEHDIDSFRQQITMLEIDTSNQLYIMGENHLYEADNQMFDLLFFDFLKKQFSKVDFIKEISHTEAFLINRFLEANDSTILQLYYAFSSCHYLTELTELKKLYDASENKFKVIGIDISNKGFSVETIFALEHINRLKKVKSYKKQLPSELERLCNLIDRQMGIITITSKKDTEELGNICTNIYEKVSTNSSKKLIYKEILGEYYNDFIRIVEDHYLGVKYYDLEVDSLHEREKILYERCKKILDANSSTKYYAKFGLYHAQKMRNKDNPIVVPYKSMTEELIKDGVKVFSGGCIYLYKARNINQIRRKRLTRWLKEGYQVENHIIEEVLKNRFNLTNNIIDFQDNNKSEMFDFIYVFNAPLAYFKSIPVRTKSSKK